MSRFQLRWRGDEALDALQAGVVAGVRTVARFIFDEAQGFVPLDGGDLRATGRTFVRASSTGATGFITYDSPPGATVALAIVQHERLTMHHGPGRKAKYLEDPIVAARRIAGQVIAQQIRRHLS
ncbi:hypothetical protein [Longispora albida]|uniref:hypothetical protein n=1 Tax=Longispora albida TaxID=203523 RepID=UPI0012F754A3|nr:hypothetical protein [Longispora albida]